MAPDFLKHDPLHEHPSLWTQQIILCGFVNVEVRRRTQSQYDIQIFKGFMNYNSIFGMALNQFQQLMIGLLMADPATQQRGRRSSALAKAQRALRQRLSEGAVLLLPMSTEDVERA